MLPLNVILEAIDASAAAESGIGAQMAAGTATAGLALTTVTPMAADADSAEFSAALNATGAAYLAAAAEHVGQRTAFAAAQALGSGTYAATEAVRAANLA